MHTLFLHPDESLFFRDGRPMGGASSGHGARFPEPHVLNGALHAACHRAFGEDPSIGHSHGYRTRADRGNERSADKTERFGSLRTAGPFPVDGNGRWHFPLPADLPDPAKGPSLHPMTGSGLPGASSLPEGLHPLGSTLPPSKEKSPDWLSIPAFEAYLNGRSIPAEGVRRNSDFFSTENAIGIGIDPATQTTAESQFYSRAQLRFREGCALGAYVEARNRHETDGDLMEQLFPADGRIRLGGEARSCTVRAAPTHGDGPALPHGPEITGSRVKWVLLGPAVFPHLPSENRADGHPHPGGWLPSWIDPKTLEVRLLDGPGERKAKRLNQTAGRPIGARLVAARIERPLVITGWTSVLSPGAASGERAPGARSTLLAVPPGSVYYFEADNGEEARKLAAALNWHGPSGGNTVVNRRSALLGEQGFGLGVCGPWTPFEQIPG